MGRISPGPTTWPPGAERRLVPAKSNHKPQTFVLSRLSSSGPVVRPLLFSPLTSWPSPPFPSCSCCRHLRLPLVLSRTFESGASRFIPGCSSPGCRSASPRMIQTREPCCLDAASCPRWSSPELLAFTSWMPQFLAGVLAVPPGCSLSCCSLSFVLCRVSPSGPLLRPLLLSPHLSWPSSPLPPTWSRSLLLILFALADIFLVGSLMLIFGSLDACSCRRRLLLHLVQPRTV